MLLAEARAQSDRLRGEGESQSTKIYADAFQQDTEFYSFYRTLQAYREVFANGQSRMVLTPDNDFLRLLREPPMLSDEVRALVDQQRSLAARDGQRAERRPGHRRLCTGGRA